MQWTPHITVLPLLIETFGNIKSIRVGLNDTLQIRVDLPFHVQKAFYDSLLSHRTYFLDSLQTKLGILDRSQVTRGKKMLQLVYGDFIEIETAMFGHAKDGRHVILRQSLLFRDHDESVVGIFGGLPER